MTPFQVGQRLKVDGRNMLAVVFEEVLPEGGTLVTVAFQHRADPNRRVLHFLKSVLEESGLYQDIRITRPSISSDLENLVFEKVMHGPTVLYGIRDNILPMLRTAYSLDHTSRSGIQS